MPKKMTHLFLLPVFLGAMLMFSPATGQATDRYWVGPDLGWWHDPNNWSPVGQPESGNNVFLTQSDGTSRTVIYYNTVPSYSGLARLTVDATGTGTMTLSQGNGLENQTLISALREDIGYNKIGIFSQSGGTNTITGGYLYLGTNSGSSGTYNLNGTGSLYAGEQYIGYSGTGTFNQSGGDSSLSGLFLGTNSGSSGMYNLSDGTLSTNYERIGKDGTGTFTQTGGTHKVAYDLHIAEHIGATGKYSLSGGLLEADQIWLHTGGTFSWTGGDLQFTKFFHDGGTVEIALLSTTTYIYNSGAFNGRLFNLGIANFNADFTAGDGLAHFTEMTIPSGRTITLNGQGLDNSGSITLAGGTLGGSGVLFNNGSISGCGTIAGTGGFVNNTFMTQSGGSLVLNNTGANANFGNIELASGKFFWLGSGAVLTNSGTLNLNSAVVNGIGTLINSNGGTIIGKGTIFTGFNNADGVLLVESGTTNITKSFDNSGLIQLAGYTANLTGGVISNSGKVEGYGNVGNGISNTGTIEAKYGTLALSGIVNNNAGGRMTAGAGSEVFVAKGLGSNAGIINLTGGSFNNNNKAMANSGQISGYGVFSTGGLSNTGSVTLTGGITTFNGQVTNQVGGEIEVAYTPAIFTGDVVNYGMVKTTQTSVTWAGTYTENGVYISDPSTNYFSTLNIGSTGYLMGGLGDSWIITEDLVNHSTQNTLWNTDEALLNFMGTGSHQLYLAGADQGANLSAFINNFAWGTLEIEGALYLLDGNGNPGGAQYVDQLLGVMLSGSTVTNIHGLGSLNIYYLASASGNEYLQGKTYNLSDGGRLIPVVPIPGAVWLLGSGLLGLVGLKRKLLG